MVVIIPRCSALFLGSKTWRNVSCVKQNIWMSLFIYKLKNKQKSLHFNKNKMLGEKKVVWWIKAIGGSWTCPDLVESGCQPCLMLSSFPTLNSLQSANICKAREFSHWFTSLFERHYQFKGLYSPVEEYMPCLLWSMGVNFSTQCNITNSGYDMPAYMLWKWLHSAQFEEERKSMGEKWKERKKNSWWEIFQHLPSCIYSAGTNKYRLHWL